MRPDGQLGRMSYRPEDDAVECTDDASEFSTDGLEPKRENRRLVLVFEDRLEVRSKAGLGFGYEGDGAG